MEMQWKDKTNDKSLIDCWQQNEYSMSSHKAYYIISFYHGSDAQKFPFVTIGRFLVHPKLYE